MTGSAPTPASRSRFRRANRALKPIGFVLRLRDFQPIGRRFVLRLVSLAHGGGHLVLQVDRVDTIADACPRLSQVQLEKADLVGRGPFGRALQLRGEPLTAGI
jgi:hypothetical protein